MLNLQIIMAHLYKSSFRFTTLTAFSKDDYRKAKHIITHIIENPESVEFRDPVPWEAFGLIDYPTIIAHPIDLGSVLRRLNDESYENVEEFLDDTELIWDNCKNYNIKGSWIYALADKLEKNCKKMLKNYFPTIPLQTVKKQLVGNPIGLNLTSNISSNQHIFEQKSTPQVSKAIKPKKIAQKPEKMEKFQKNQKLYYQDEQQISTNQKMKLADKFKTLSPQKNSEIVQYIQQICPTAFRETDQKVQILVDNMDVITFKQLMEKIEEIQLVGTSSKKIKLD